MKLRCIANVAWSLWVEEDDAGRTLEDEVPDEFAAQWAAFIQHVVCTDKGPRALPNNRNHAICENPKILQLTPPGQGLRTPYVLEADRKIILTHIFVKGGQPKTPPSEIKKAKTFLARYEAEKAAGNIQWLPIIEDDQNV